MFARKISCCYLFHSGVKGCFYDPGTSYPLLSLSEYGNRFHDASAKFQTTSLYTFLKQFRWPLIPAKCVIPVYRVIEFGAITTELQSELVPEKMSRWCHVNTPDTGCTVGCN